MKSGIFTDRLIPDETGRLVPGEQASFTELLDNQEGIILDLGNLHYYTLNATAVFLWKQLRSQGTHTSATLSESLAAAFSVSASQAKADTTAFLRELGQYGLLSQAPLTEADSQAEQTQKITGLPAYVAPQLALTSSLAQVTLSGTSVIASAAVGGS